MYGYDWFCYFPSSVVVVVYVVVAISLTFSYNDERRSAIALCQAAGRFTNVAFFVA